MVVIVVSVIIFMFIIFYVSDYHQCLNSAGTHQNNVLLLRWMPECCSGTSCQYSCFMFQNAPFQAEINNQKYRLSSSNYTKMHLWQGLGEFTVSVGPLDGFQRPLRGRGREKREGRKGEGRRKRKEDGRGGELSPTSFCYNLTTDLYHLFKHFARIASHSFDSYSPLYFVTVQSFRFGSIGHYPTFPANCWTTI